MDHANGQVAADDVIERAAPASAPTQEQIKLESIHLVSKFSWGMYRVDGIGLPVFVVTTPDGHQIATLVSKQTLINTANGFLDLAAQVPDAP